MCIPMTLAVIQAVLPGTGQPAGGERGPALLTEKPLAPGAGADPLRKLLVTRYNAALADVQKRYQAAFGVANGTPDVEALGRAAERLLKAGLELSGEPADRVKVHERHVELVRHLEKFAEAADRAGVSKSRAELEVARYYRIDAEIGLLRAREAAPKK